MVASVTGAVVTADASFNEFQLIVCRHVSNDSGAALQRRARRLFADSMPLFGMLGVDCDEGLKEAPFSFGFTAMAGGPGLYRRIAWDQAAAPCGT